MLFKVQYTRQDKITPILNGCLAEIGMKLLVFESSRHDFFPHELELLSFLIQTLD